MREARMLAIAELIRTYGPAKAAALVKEADKAHKEGRGPDLSLLFAWESPKPPEAQS